VIARTKGRAWEDIKDNIKISVKKSLGLYEFAAA